MIASECWPPRGWPGSAARENQPYVVPVYLSYDVLPGGEPCLYGFTTPGQKVEWMRANPLVCVEVDDVVAHDQWMSVIAFGRYEELPEYLRRRRCAAASREVVSGRPL